MMKLPAPLKALSQRLIPDPGRRAVARKAVNFALVGVINAAVDFGIFSLLHFHFGLPIITSNLISWLVAVSGSYVMNSMTTFAAESGRQLRLKAYFHFLIAQIAGLVANTATILVVSYLATALFAIGTTAADLIGKFLSIGASFLVNFTLSHFVVFRKRRPTVPGF